MRVKDVERLVCQCQAGQGPDNIEILAKAVLSLHRRKGCCRELVSVIGRLYTVVAARAGGGL